MRRNRFSAVLALAALAVHALATSAGAAVLTIGTTAPVVDGEDIASALGAGTGGEKLWTDTRAIGQTFTTGSVDVVLDAITLQLWGSGQPTKGYTLTVGSVSGNTYTSVLSTETFTQSVASASGDYFTMTLDTPLTLSANSDYGFDLAMDSSTSGWGSGIPYMASTANSVYADGQAFRSTVNRQSTSPFSYINSDKVFHLNLEEAGGPPPPGPVSLLSTDFTGRTVSGATAGNIPWTTNGVADPGDLTAVDIDGAAPPPFGLFDTGSAQGHFAPNLNTGNEGPWSVDVPINLTAPEVEIQDVVLDWQHFDNSGAFQTASRSVDWTATVTGSLSGVIGTETALGVSGTSGIETLTFSTPLTLTSDESWTLQILAEGSNNTGNNTGLDAINVIGLVNDAVIPEPSTLALAALGLLGLGFCGRRRRRLP